MSYILRCSCGHKFTLDEFTGIEIYAHKWKSHDFEPTIIFAEGLI